MNRANQKKYVFRNAGKCKKTAKKVLIFYGKLFKIELCSEQARRACAGRFLQHFSKLPPVLGGEEGSGPKRCPPFLHRRGGKIPLAERAKTTRDYKKDRESLLEKGDFP